MAKSILPVPQEVKDRIGTLRKKTDAELRTSITTGLTRREMLTALNNGSDRIQREPVRHYRTDAQIERDEQVEVDVETDAQVSKRVVTWTYYEDEPGHPVDTITIQQYDANDALVSRKVIKHYVDGRQPEVI